MSNNQHVIVNIINILFDNDKSLMDLAVGSSHHDLLNTDFDEFFLTNLFKKAENLPTDIDPIAAAKQDFLDFLLVQEEKVVSVQTVLDNLDSSPVLKRIMENAKAMMKEIFHDFHPALIKPRFTLGSTLTLPKGASIFSRVKASEGHQTLVTNFGALYPDYCDILLDSYPHTYGDDSNYVKINVVAKLHNMGRVIGSPPSSLLAFQCGFGDYVEGKLVRFCKINLKTAQQLHRSLAMEHSLLDVFSTLDQRKASDNILRILAFWLTPEEVASYMDAISPRSLKIDDEFFHTHMLCAAGNGFNTAFQTLLFNVLIRAIQEELRLKHNVYVYGDDVIAHKDVYDSVCKVFPLLGLEINQDKSFKEGPFRESCGGDYLYGNNIRPFYAKLVPETAIDWIRFINGIRRVGYYNNADVWRSDNIRNLWFWSILHIAEDDRLFCPRHYGDAGINTEDTVLYQFGNPIRWDRERVKYPREGYDDKGNPYGAERICIYVATTGGEKSTFAEESKGLAVNETLRLISHASVKNSGLILRKNAKPHQKMSYYPAVYNGLHDTYKKTYVPYTFVGQAPENVDDLFDFIQKGNGSRITNSDHVVARYELRKRSHISEVMGLLNLYVEKRLNLRDNALKTMFEFTL